MKHIGKQLRFIAAALLTALMLSACSESMEDLNNYIAAVEARPADPIAPIPPVKTYTPYAVSYTHLTLPTTIGWCSCRWWAAD